MKKKEILSLFTLHYSKLTIFRLISDEKLLLRRTFGNLNCSVVNECEEARESSTFSSFFPKWIKKDRIVIVMVEGWKRGRISTSTIWHRIEKKKLFNPIKKRFHERLIPFLVQLRDVIIRSSWNGNFLSAVTTQLYFSFWLFCCLST